MTLRGNTFETNESGLKASYSGQSPLPNYIGFAGIHLTEVTSGLAMDANPATGEPNYFRNLRMGILAQNATFAVRNSVFSNILQTTKPTGYPGPSQTGRAIYTDNCTVNVLGIFLSSGARTHLTANNVQINTPAGPKRYGIHVAGGEQNLVNCNDILGAGSRGILGEMASRTDFLCNTADGLYLDGVFTGSAPAIFVGDNKLKNNAQGGLLLGSNALIGPQTHRGNRWSNSGGMTLARHLGGVGLAQFSEFIVDASENSEYLPTLIDPSFDWFININDTETSFFCNPTADCPPPSALTGEGEQVDRHTAKGTLTGFEHQEHSLWLAQKRLYRRLVYEENPYTNDADFDGFLGTQIIGSAGQFAAVEQGLHTLFALPEADWTALDTAEAAISLYLGQLADVELLLAADDLDSQDSTDLEASRADILAQIELLSADLEGRREAISDSRASAAGALNAQNAALGDTTAYEANEKAVNALRLQTLARGVTTLTEQQRTTLEAIAVQCPMADGEAVLHARALLALTDGEYDFSAYDDSTACIFSRPEATSSTLRNLTYGQISVYPNPANQTINIQVGVRETEMLSFRLFSTLGRLVVDERLSIVSGIATLSVGHLPNGAYYYFTNEGHSGKISIQH